MSIEVTTTFTADGLPSVSGLGAALASDSRVSGFFTLAEPFAGVASVSGVDRITGLSNRAAGALAFTQASDLKKPAAVTVNQPAGARDAGSFDVARGDAMGLTGTFSTDVAHSYVVIGQWSSLAAQRGMMGRNTSGTSRDRLGFTTNQPEVLMARGNAEAKVPFAFDVPTLVIGAWDGGTTVKCAVNNGSPVSATISSGDGGSAATFGLGALGSTGSGPSGGYYRHTMLINVDIFHASNADLLALVREFAAVVDGVGV